MTAGGTLPNGWVLFDAAVRWAVETPKAPVLLVTNSLSLGTGEAAVLHRLQLSPPGGRRRISAT